MHHKIVLLCTLAELELAFQQQHAEQLETLKQLETLQLFQQVGVHDKTNTVRSEEDQRSFELKCAREKEVAMLHDVSHRHNRGLLNDLIAAGVETLYLKCYILKHNSKWCAANRGKRRYLTKSHVIPAGEILISTIVDPQDPNTTITETLAKQFQTTSPMYSVRSLEDTTVSANSPSTFISTQNGAGLLQI
jgi:hypothetical protein